MIAHCFVGDLLGFSNLIMNLPPEHQETRVKEWINLARSCAQEETIEQFQLISDTIFASAEPNSDGLQRLINFSRLLLENGGKMALPIRGAISVGEVNWGNEVTFGKAIVNAYKLAENQNWIGVVLHPDVTQHSNLWSWDSLVTYPAPMKSGLIRNFPAVVWNIPAFNEFVVALTSEGLVKDGDPLNWSWAEKVQSTLLLRIYLRMLQPHGAYLDPAKFHGRLPIEMLAHMSSDQVFLRLQGAENKLVRLTLGCPAERGCASSSLPPLPQNV